MDESINNTTVTCHYCHQEIPVEEAGTVYDPDTNDSFFACADCFYSDGDGWEEESESQ